MELKTALILSGVLVVTGVTGTIGSSFLTDDNAPFPQMGGGWDEHTVDPNDAPNRPRRYVPTGDRQKFTSTKRLAESANSTKVDSSVGDYDARMISPLAIQQFDSVGKFITPISQCTATAITIDGYQSVNGKDLILTNHHCAFNSNASDVAFVAETVDLKGKREIYSSRASLKFHPIIDVLDLAILELEKPLPEYLVPARLISDFSFENNQNITTAGYSADSKMDGLTMDSEGTVISNTYHEEIQVNSDITSRASGSPVIIRHDPKQSIVGGVMTSVANGTDYSYFTYVPSEFLDDVPFIERTPNNPKRPETKTCLRVTAQTLNARQGPSIDFEIVAKLGSDVVVTEMKKMGSWSFVHIGGGDAAYIANKYTQQTPCFTQ